MQNEAYLGSPGTKKLIKLSLGNKLVHQRNVRINFSCLT